MKVTSVTKNDIDCLKKIARTAILTSVKAEEHEKSRIIRDTDKHIDQNAGSNECVFLKHESNRVTAFILIQGFWNLSDLFVLPEEHGKGIGSVLLNEAMSICQKINDKGYILVNSSLNAEGFYRRHGFETFASKKEFPDFVVPLIYRF